MANTFNIKLKRGNQTVFLYADPTDKVADVKKKLGAIIKQSPDGFRILSSQQASLDDERTLGDLKAENNEIFYWVQRKEGNEWEQVNVQKFPLKQEDSDSMNVQ